MPQLPKFLIVDDNADSRYLLVKTLLRKFPQAILKETRNGEHALALTKAEKLDALVVHRALEFDGVELVALARRANPIVPIVVVSGIDREKEALAAGANAFLLYDAWLRIGTVVAELLASPASAARRGGDHSAHEAP